MEGISIWFRETSMRAMASKNICHQKRIEYEQLNVNTHEHQIRKVDD